MAEPDREPEPTTKPARRKARALIVLDPFGATGFSPEEQYQALLLNWRELFDVELDARLVETFNPRASEAEGCDLIVLDWGALGAQSHLMQEQVRWVVTWAEDHPSALVVIQSLAGDFLEEEIERERMPKLANILIFDPMSSNPPSWWFKPAKSADQPVGAQRERNALRQTPCAKRRGDRSQARAARDDSTVQHRLELRHTSVLARTQQWSFRLQKASLVSGHVRAGDSVFAD